MSWEEHTIEPLQFLDERHDVSKKTLNTLERVMYSQDNYGIEKYKKPLNHTMNYDWLQMFLEEIADGLKYIQNEMDRRALVIEILECALDADNPKYVILSALEILKSEGTGK